jgi:hypothetical protein
VSRRFVFSFLIVLSVFAFAFIPAFAQQNVPANQAYSWKNVEIVGGGFVPGIIMHPAKKDLVYARTDIGGSYRWDPAVRRWIPLTDFFGMAESNLYGAESVGIDPSDPNRLYLAVGIYTKSWAGNAAILRSSDQGRTFQRTDLPFKMGGNEDGRSAGERIGVDPNDGSIVYFGSRLDGLWKSTDHGTTWNKVTSFPVTGATDGVGVVFVLFDKSSATAGKATRTIYAGVSTTKVSLYRSMDAGATWEAVPGAPKGLMPNHGVITSDSELYVSYGDHPGPNGMTDGAVWRLDTKKSKWKNITPLIPGVNGTAKFGYGALAVDNAHPTTLMVATMDRWWPGDEIYRSLDGGAHWKAMSDTAVQDASGAPWLAFGKASPGIGHWIGDIEIDPSNPAHVLYVTGATIWGSDDANGVDRGYNTHWSVRAQGLEETAVLGLISPSTGAHLLSALGDIGGFKHDDLAVVPNAPLNPPAFSTTSDIEFAGQHPTMMARVGWSEHSHGSYSTDGGATWAPFQSEPSKANGNGAIAVSATGSTFVWSLGDGDSFYSRDHGKSWTACQGLPKDSRVIADRANPGEFYATERNGGKIYVSTDGAATFAAAAQNLPNEHGQLRAVPELDGDLWLASKGGLFYSSDSAATFNKIETVQEAYAIGFGKAAPGRNYPAIFLAGKVNGVQALYRSDDKAATWVRINDDQHQYGWLNPVIGDPRIYGRVYIGTNGRGIVYGDIQQ